MPAIRSHFKPLPRPPRDFTEVREKPKEKVPHVFKATGQVILKAKNHKDSGNGCYCDPLYPKQYQGTEAFRNGKRPPFIYRLANAASDVFGTWDDPKDVLGIGETRAEGKDGLRMALMVVADCASILDDLAVCYTSGGSYCYYSARERAGYGDIGVHRNYRHEAILIKHGFLVRLKDGVVQITDKLLEALSTAKMDLVEEFRRAKQYLMDKGRRQEAEAKQASKKEDQRKVRAEKEAEIGRKNRAAGRLGPPEPPPAAQGSEAGASGPAAAGNFGDNLAAKLKAAFSKDGEGSGETGPPG